MISNLANALVERGFEVTILCTYDLGTPAYTLDPNVQVIYLTALHPNREDFLFAVRNKKFLRVIREGIYAVKVLLYKRITMKKAIVAIEEGTIISTRHEHSLLLSKYGSETVNKIAQLHHDHNFQKKLMYEFCHRYQNIDYFILLTDQHTEEISSRMKRYNTHTQCLTIPNFLDFPPLNQQVSIQNQVISVGRLAKEKGFDRLIQIWSFISPHLPGWKMKIVGDGVQKEVLKNLIHKLEIEDSVILTGALSHEDTLREMQKSRIYAMASYTEAFSLVIAEAQSCGLPVVAFDVRVGPRALITNGKDGFLVKDGDLQKFAEKVLSIARDAVLREQFRRAALESAKKYAKDQVIDRWMQIL